MKNIGIILSGFSGHLFHDLEMFLVSFYNLNNNFKQNEIIFYFIYPKLFYKKQLLKNFNWILLIINKIFNTNQFNFINITMINKFSFYYVVNRKYFLNQFYSIIEDFPAKYWYNKFGIIKNKKTLNVLYSTRQSTNRRLTNNSHKFITEIVKKFNGIIVNFQDLEPLEQINLCKDIDIFIGVHGNNLSNIVWMKPNSVVIELLPYDFVDSHPVGKLYCYHLFSKCFKHNFYQIDCQADYKNSEYDILESERKYINCIFNIYNRIHNSYN